LRKLVPAMFIPAPRVLPCDRIDSRPEGIVDTPILVIEFNVDVIPMRAQPCFDVREGQFDRVEVGE
jgi:hypothetical protein